MNLFAFLFDTPRLVMEGDTVSFDVSQLLASTTSLRTALEYQLANGGALDPETRDGLYSEIVAWVNVLDDVNQLRVQTSEEAGRRLIDEGHAHCGRYAAALGGITHHLDLAATTLDPEMSSWAVRELSTHRYSLQEHRVELERWVADIKASAGTETRKVHFDIPETESSHQSAGGVQEDAQAPSLNSWSDPGYPQGGSASFQTPDGTWFQPEYANQAPYGVYPQDGYHAQQNANPFQPRNFSPYENYPQHETHAQDAFYAPNEPNTRDTSALFDDDDDDEFQEDVQDQATHAQETISVPEGNARSNALDASDKAAESQQQALHAKLAEKLKAIEAEMETMAAHLESLGMINIAGPELDQARELLTKAAGQSRKDLREFSDNFSRFRLPDSQENWTSAETERSEEQPVSEKAPVEAPQKPEMMDDGTQTEEVALSPEHGADNTVQDVPQFMDAITAYEIPAEAAGETFEMIDDSTQTEEATPEPTNSSTEKQDVPEFQDDAVVVSVNPEGMPTFETSGTYDMGYYEDDSQAPSVVNDPYFEEHAETRQDGTRIVEFFPASEISDHEDMGPRVYDDFYAVVVDEPPVELEIMPEREMTVNGTQTVENTLESQLDESLKREKDVFNFMYPPVEALNGEMRSADNSTQTAEAKPVPESIVPPSVSSPSSAPSAAPTATTEARQMPIVRPPSYIGLDSTSKAIIDKDTRHITKVFNKIVAGGFNKLGLNLGVVNTEGEDWVHQFCEDHRFLNGVLMAITQPKRIFLWNVRNLPVDSDSWTKGSLVRTISIVTDPPRYLHSFPFRHRRNIRPEGPKLLLHWNIEKFSEKTISARFKDVIQTGGQLQQRIGSFSYKQMVVCVTIPWAVCKAYANGESSEDEQKALELLGRMGILSSIPVEGRIGNEVREGAWCPSWIKIGGEEQSVHAFLQETTYSGSPEMEPQMPSTPTRFVVVTMRKGETGDWVDAVHSSLGMNYHSLRYSVSTDEAIDYSQLRKYYRGAISSPQPVTPKTE